MPYSISVIGSESLRRKLMALGSAVAGRRLADALAAGAVVIQEAAKNEAPYREGDLSASIHIGGYEELAPDYYRVHDGGEDPIPAPEINGMQSAVYVGTGIVYAFQREYGGTIYAKNAPMLVWQDYEGNWHQAYSVTQDPTPFMRPAVDENVDEVGREIAAALGASIRVAVTSG